MSHGLGPFQNVSNGLLAESLLAPYGLVQGPEVPASRGLDIFADVPTRETSRYLLPLRQPCRLLHHIWLEARTLHNHWCSWVNPGRGKLFATLSLESPPNMLGWTPTPRIHEASVGHP